MRMDHAPLYTYKKLDFFDGLEIFEAKNDTDFFPFHKHDSFCISIITSGVEIFENRQGKYIIPANTISITQANEAHKNCSLSEMGYSYKTLYVNGDLLAYFNNGVKINHLSRTIVDAPLFNALTHLFDDDIDIGFFEESMKQICCYADDHIDEHNIKFSLDILESLVTKDFHRVIDIEHLASKFHLSKFHFIREFKKQTGITPQSYITLFKLEQARVALRKQHTSIKDIAYDFGFCDISHFSNTFKKFYGVFPSQYVNAF